MKITVMGASGLIGTKVAGLLAAGGHEVVAASRGSGADVLTGEGLGEALAGADVIVDVTNSPSFEDGPVLKFFTKATTNVVAAAKTAGVGHYVVLSIVGPTVCRTATRYASPTRLSSPFRRTGSPPTSRVPPPEGRSKVS